MSRRAYAFGGFWSSQTAPVKQAAEEIVFVDNPDSTVTAIVQIKYAGPSQKFAWVIPMPGRPTIGVSSNTVFRRLDAATAPEYWVEVTVEGRCKPQDRPDAASGADSGGGWRAELPRHPSAASRDDRSRLGRPLRLRHHQGRIRPSAIRPRSRPTGSRPTATI